MLINTLCAAFRKLAIDRISTAAATTTTTTTTTTTVRYYSVQQSNFDVSRYICNDHGVPCNAVPANGIKFKPGTLNIDFGISIRRSIPNIIEIPVAKIPPLREPTKNLPIQYDNPVPQTIIDLPTIENNFEKQAIRLIVIRRKKIKKHKRKKLRKRMKYVWAKRRQRRNLQKMKNFENSMIAKIKEAQAFDPSKYVQERLNILNKERLPRTYRGEILPPEMIKQFLEEKEAKKRAKLNQPRLTL